MISGEKWMLMWRPAPGPSGSPAMRRSSIADDEADRPRRRSPPAAVRRRRPALPHAALAARPARAGRGARGRAGRAADRRARVRLGAAQRGHGLRLGRVLALAGGPP